MKKKGILIICLIICVICSISAVSAADVYVNDTDDTIMATPEDTEVAESGGLSSFLLSDDDETVLGEGEVGSFKDLQNLINNDTTGIITLDKNYTYNEATDADLVTIGIPISAAKTIQGNGQNIVIDAKGVSRIFQLSGTITLKDITFVNGFNSMTSPIYSSGTLTVSGCTFINNTGLNGGALQSAGSLTMESCTFINNTAIYGGAIQTGSSPFSVTSISDSKFINNTAITGGSLHTNGIQTILSNLEIIDGTADQDGGAIYLGHRDMGGRPVPTNVRLSNIIIRNSNAANSGGAVMIRGLITSMNNITIVNCSAVNGGALYFGALALTMDDLKLIKNTATNNGGAIYFWPDSVASSTNGLTNSILINNTAGGDGGAIYAYGNGGDIITSTFIDNNAANGGAVYVHGNNWKLTDSTFTNNSAFDSIVAKGNGGAVMWDGSNGFADNLTFSGNNASNRGGAMFIENCYDVTIANSGFDSNFAGINGGAVEFYKYAIGGHVINSTFNNNVANRSGGAVLWFGDIGSIQNSKFNNNEARGLVMAENSFGVNTTGGHGGAVMWTGAHGLMDNCTFDENTAAVNGGAIFMQGSTEGDCKNVTVSNSRFNDNFAGVNGGAVEWYKGAHNCTLENATFNNNIANRSGGAVFWWGTHGTIKNATFIDNEARGLVMAENSFGVNTTGGHGGAVMWTGADGVIDNCTFESNNAKVNGGAIFMQGSTDGDCKNVTVSNGIFKDNFAGVNGGAVDWYKGAQDCILENASFTNNVANRSGGAVFWWGTHGSIKNAIFIDNEARGLVMAENSFGVNTTGGHGGAIMWTGSNGIIYNSTFKNNTAKVNGGAVFMQGSTEGNCSNLTVDLCKFDDNNAGVNGGAIEWYRGAQDGNLLNSAFRNNTAQRSGGAVYWYGENGKIRNTSFSNNKALGLVNASSSYGYNTTGGDGGAVMWTGSNGIVDNCNFTDNYAAVRGGAVFLQGSLEGYCMNVTVSNSLFENNVAETNGGAVNFYLGARNGRILNSTFKNNNATTGIGGAVVWRGYNGTVQGSSFIENSAQNDGGAVYIEGNLSKVYNSSFDNNTAGDDGGAVYWTGDLGEIHNITANNNRGISYGTSHSKGGTMTITGSNMTIDMAKINLGYAEVNGGAIFLSGNNVNITNSDFTNNKVQTDNGGALYIIGNNTHLINTTIEKSSAIHGGGIYWEGHDGYVDNLTMIHNNSTEDGAGMTVVGERCEIYNSTFEDNIAHDDGGAIHWAGNNGKLYNCNFTNNRGISNQRGSASRGGAISLTGANMTIDKSNFTQCYVDYTTTTADMDRLDGGALFITGNNATITNSNFEECNATHAGGAIYVIGNYTTIDGCDFKENNIIRKGGGAIFVEGTKGRVSNSNFTGNIVNSTLTVKDTYGGGAIFWTGGKSGDIITGCIFTNNTAYISFSESGETSGGGAIFWAKGGSGGGIEHCEFYNNSVVSKVDSLGGAINWDRSSNGIINNCTFVGNYATTTGTGNRWVQGGALYWRSINGTVIDSTFIDCWSDNEAGAVYWSAQTASGTFDYDANGYIINCTFENNYDKAKVTNNNYKSGGGAVLVKESVNVYFINSTFTNNTSQRYGGAISVGGNTENVNCDGCIFINNTCPDTGGALFWTDGYIYNSKFINNSVSMEGTNAKYGGAIYSSRSGVVIFNSSFENNTIPFNRGGAVYLTGTNVNITNTTFKYNSVLGLQGKEALGGALWLSGADDIVDGCIFIGNSANGTGQWLQGGALAVNAARPVINNTYFADNYCEHEGGALYIQGSSGIVENCTFERNTANGARYAEGYFGGGAIYVKSTSGLTVNDIKVINNTALTGGGIFLFSGSATFNNCIIENNTAETGAGVYNHGNTATFNDCEFNNNIASDRGGAIYAKGNTVLNNITFNGNNAKLGGALYSDYGRTYSNIKAFNNTAEQGGAIYFAAGGNTLQNAILQYNKADYGSALYFNVNVDQNLRNVVILDNQALALQFAEMQETITGDTLEYSVLFEGGDNIINGIYDVYNRVYMTNVTYWGVSNGVGTVRNTGNSRVIASKTNPTSSSTGLYQTQREAGINITFTLYDENNNVRYNITGVTDIAGNVTFTVTDADIASFDLRLTHYEDNYYTALSYASKNLTKVVIEVVDIDYGQMEYANITVSPIESTITAVPSGNITVYVDGEQYGNFTLDENGKFTLNLTKLTVGTHSIRVIYKGDANFLSEINQTTFKVKAIPYELIIKVDDYYYGNIGRGTVTVPDYVTGLVNITIEGQNYTVNVTDQKTVPFEFQLLTVGNYTVYGSYPETDTYYGCSNSTNFTVMKANSTITIVVNYGQVADIIVTVGEYNCTGNVTITVDGDEMNFTLVNGQAIRQVTGLSSGNHTVNVTYTGDWNHYGSYNDTKFEVIKSDTPIYIEADNLTYGENQTIAIYIPHGISGQNITVTFNNETRNYTIVNGRVLVPANDLAVGEYLINVTYDGDAFYLANSTSDSFWVNKTTPVMTVDVENIIYNQTEEHIEVNINQTGNVTIRVIDANNNSWIIENPEIEIMDGQVTWNVSTLAAGEYIAEVTYNGNQNYTSLAINKTFVVSKAPTNLTINVTNNIVGETTVINITVSPEKATGNVYVYIDGVEYIKVLENGSAIIERTDLAYGNHSVTAFYDGDRNFTGSRNSTRFLQNYSKGIFIIEAQNITVGDNETIKVSVPDDAEGIVLITVDGIGYYINVGAGERNITIQNLKPGTYPVSGTWINDSKYGTLTNDTDFTVNMTEDYIITVTAEDIEYGENATVIVTLPGDATGNVTIYIDGVNKGTINITNGVAVLENVTGLKAGEHMVNVTYNGNSIYLPKDKNETTFNVLPTDDWTLNLTVDAHAYGEDTIFTLNLPENVSKNVTLEIEGVNYTVALNNGEGELRLHNLSAGLHEVTAYYPGDENYTAKSNATTFLIGQAVPTIIIDTDSIKVGENATIEITVSGNATGNVTIYIGNQTFERFLENHTVKLNVSDLTSGNHNIVAVYGGDQNYTSSVNSTNITVEKIPTQVNITVGDKYFVGDDFEINVTNSTAAIVTINGKKYAIVDGKVDIDTTVLPAGNYTATVTIYEDEKFLGNTSTAEFEIIKRQSEVNITISGDNPHIIGETFTITVTNNTEVNVTINGKSYLINATGQVIINTNELPAGEYIVTANIAENDKYFANATSKTFNIVKKESGMTIVAAPESVVVGKNTTITVTMAGNETGTVIIEVNGANHTVAINNGIAVLNVTLPVGDYIAKAYYLENNNYNASSNISNSFNVVNKTSAWVNITADNIIEIDNNLTFTVDTNSNSTLVVKVNGVVVTPVDGVYTFNGTVAGNYTIAAEVAENDYYTQASNSTVFTVIKHNSTVSIDVDEVYEIESDFNIGIANNTAVVVTINGKEYTVADGKVVIDTTALPAGHYIVTATIAENDKYYANSITKEFDIIKINSNVNVTADPIKVGETAVIEIAGPNDYDGMAVVTVDGKDYMVKLTGGIGQLEIAGLCNGTYDINVTYLENDKYLQSVNDTVKLIVSKVDDAEITSSVENITVGEPAVIKVTLPYDATGNVTVTIGNITKTVPIAGGENEIIVLDVHVGEHDVNITYNGDEKYLPMNTTDKLKVSPVNVTEDDIKVVDQGNGTVVVIVPEDATGNVTITINGTNYTAPVINGTATFDLTNETPGTYDITATYSGDENHTGAAKNATVTISKYPTPMDIEVNSTVVGEIAKVIVSVPENVTGNVTVEIDGKTYSVKPVDGQAVFEIEGLAYGNKTITATYAGDDSYLANSTTAQFEVAKAKSSVNVTGDEIKVDETATIEITGPADYNGTAVVTIDGKDYSVNMTNGVGKLEVTGLANGTYDVKVTLLANDKYMSSSNSTAKVIVNKVSDAPISASADNITVGDPAVIKVTVPEDATGNVTVTIGNITRTVPIAGGENEILVPGVPVGDYEVKVTYNGDDKYLPANTTTSLTVKPVETDPADIKVVDQGNGTVMVVVPANATGNVTVTINGTNYTSPVINGTATFDLTDEAPGTYDITASYSGDENYSAATSKGNVTIPKYSTPMSIEVKDGKVGETIEVTVNVPEDLKDNVTVEVNGKTYSAKPSGGKAVFEITGLLSGNKTVTATYGGDEWYIANATTANFTVSKNPAPISVEVDNSTSGQATIIVTLPDDATGYVIVNVYGRDYGINLTDGDKAVTVPISGTGDYVAEVTYLGDEKYLGNSTSKDFYASSSKTHPNIAAEVENVPVGEDVEVKVTVPEGGDGNVTVTVDNVTVTASVTGGENIIKIPGVSEGTHDVNISYSGNDQYEAEKITKTVSVFKSIIAEDLTRGWNSPYDYKAEFLDETGHVLADTNVQFVVNGKTYTAKTNSQGIAYLDTSKLAIGEYNVTCINPVTGEQVTAKTTIVKRLIENKDITMDFMDGTWYTVRAIGDDGKPVGEGEFVQISVHTISYSCKTDKNGYAKLKINLNPKKYTITAEYKNTKVSNKLVVKQTLKLVKKTVTVKKGKKLVLRASFKWSNGKAIKGKVIKIKFKGKTYKAKTNSKGIAKVTIKTKITKKLKKGKKYAYSATYEYNTVKGKVKVK